MTFFALVLKRPMDGLDLLLQAFFAELEHFTRGSHPCKKAAGCLVDADVGCLGGKCDRDQERVGIDIFQLRLGCWILFRQPAEKLENIGLLHAASMTSRIV